jgi:hypothetical protein
VPFTPDGQQPLFSRAEEEQINTVPSAADEVPDGHPADGFEHDLCHRLGDVCGDAGQRASPRGRGKCRQRLNEGHSEDGITSAGIARATAT